MKSLYTAGLLLLTAFTMLTSSCKKEDGDAMIPPAISFKTGTGYTSANAIIAKGTAVLIGVNAAKSEPNDVLTLFNVSRSYDSAAAGTVYSETLSGASGDTYSKDYPIVTRTTTGTEKYTFTVSNRDGLTNSVSLTLTVQ